MIRTKNVQYTVNMDVTQYVDGVRETLNPTGKVFAASAWEFYNVNIFLIVSNTTISVGSFKLKFLIS